MQILTIANQKGGSGKSTTAAALTQAAASKGLKALCIDLDPQGNTSFILNADMSKQNSLDLLTGTPAKDIMQEQAGIFIIPASWDLQTVTTSKGSARRLQNALQPLDHDFDIVIIDTPPTAGELQYNALQAATDLIIPVQADILSLQGLYQIANTAEQFQKSNTALKNKYLVFTRNESRSVIAKQLTETITEEAAALGIKTLTAIPKGVAIAEAQATQQSLFDYAPKSKPALAYMQLFNDIYSK